MLSQSPLTHLRKHVCKCCPSLFSTTVFARRRRFFCLRYTSFSKPSCDWWW